MCCIERDHSDRLTSTLGFVSIVRIARLTTCLERSEQFTKETNDELLFSEIAEGIFLRVGKHRFYLPSGLREKDC